MVRTSEKFVVVVDVVAFDLLFLVSCDANPCQFVANVYDPTTGYCCTNLPTGTILPTTGIDSVCTCPSAAPVVNGPCRKK